MSKKGRVVLISAVLSTIILATFLVSAQTPTTNPVTSDFVKGFQEVVGGIIEFLDVILSPILGSSEVAGITAGGVLLIKALFFVIIIAFVWSVLDKLPLFNTNKWAVVLVSIAVSILSTRFLLTPGWIQTILLPYNVLGITLAALAPLIIFFYFVEQSINNKTLRKASWLFALTVFLFLFITRLSEIKAIVPPSQFNPAWIYLVAGGVCLVFFFADKTIQRAWNRSRAENVVSLQEAQEQADIAREVRLIRQDIAGGVYVVGANGRINNPAYRARRNALRGRAAAVGIRNIVDALPPAA